MLAVPYFNNQHITCLLYTEKYGVVVGTTKGLFIQNKSSKDFNALLDSVNITSVSQSNDKLYIGSDNGLYLLDLAKHTKNVFHVNNGLIDENITSVLCQKRNSMDWL